MFYQMNSFMLANELIQYFRNTPIATAVNCPIDVKLGRKTEKCYVRVTVYTEKEGCMSHTAPEDAQRPRAVKDIHPDFRGI